MRQSFTLIDRRWQTSVRFHVAVCFGLLAFAVVGCAPGGAGSPAAGSAGDSENSAGQSAEALETLTAELLVIEQQPWAKIVRSQGNLIADEQAVVGAKVAGRVATVHVDLGDFVSAETPLVTLDQGELELKVAQAAALLEQARSAVGLAPERPVSELDPEKSPPVRQEKALWRESQNTLQRARQLYSEKAFSRGELEQAEAAEQVASARYAASLNSVSEKIALIGVRQTELNLAEQFRRDAVIVAPIDGYVQQRQVAPGSYLAIGQPILVLVSTDPLRFRGTVPERYAQQLRGGQAVRIHIDSLDGPIETTISRISPALDLRSRALIFEALIDNQTLQLKAGLFGEAEIFIDPEARGFVLPASAISEFAGVDKVWKVIDGVASEHAILTGQRRDGRREVLEGLAEGDVILKDASQGRIARVLESGTAELETASLETTRLETTRLETTRLETGEQHQLD